MSTTQRSAFTLAFGLMLAFLQVILVAAEGDVVCSAKPPVLPSNDLYTQHCPHDKGDRSGRNWPCFTHSSGSLHGADVSRSTSDDQFDNESLLLAKDADLVCIKIEFNPLYDGGHILAVSKIDPKSEYRLFITSDDDVNTVILDSDKQGSNLTIGGKNYFIHLRKEKPEAN
ncbi:related to Mig1 protein [Sporisorium reilianum f. sp. reilianum]|uniref:Related to Mig1 protein n=1 Tax=Sporisorium reilianum f. sp. reilianum TaxID=72559 RepID=A0A2N8UF76_9BASI|nr:related to Mig1 protein [Sporisorium reilianum f. sp. reilianum]